jgi:hypothetical protein
MPDINVIVGKIIGGRIITGNGELIIHVFDNAVVVHPFQVVYPPAFFHNSPFA